MKQRVQNFFKGFDMFAAPASLRAQGSSSVTRTSAGVISFILFCYFTYIFILGLYRIFTFESITSSQNFQKIPLKDLHAESFMFGVGNLKLQPQFLSVQFDIKILLRSTKQGILYNMTMVKCSPEQWKLLGNDYQQQFQLHYLDRFVCPSEPEKLKIINSTLVQSATYFEILIEPSNSSFSQQFWQRWRLMQQYQTNKFNIFFLDQAVIQKQEDPVQYFININHFAYLSSFKRHRTLIRLSNFKINTDFSLIPIYEDVETVQGKKIEDFVLTDVDSALEDENTKITFQLTNDLYIYNRKVGKIDEMFSYAGGLFALVIWCLAFFVASFNQYRYELMVAEGVFNYDKDGHKIRQTEFNFLKYIKFSLYQWIKYYFCYKPKWRDCQQIEATIAQANNQMDVTKLFRKLQFLQMALVYTMNQSQNLIIALTQPRSLSQVKQQRLILQYYFAVIKGEPAATVSDAIDGNAARFQNLKQSPLKYESKQISYSSLVESSNQSFLLSGNDEIRQNLMHYLQLQQYQQICGLIAKYPVALEQAKLVVLSPEHEKIQRHLTEHFLRIKPYTRVRIMGNIPLKIIHRLCLKAEQIEKGEVPQEEKQSHEVLSHEDKASQGSKQEQLMHKKQ